MRNTSLFLLLLLSSFIWSQSEALLNQTRFLQSENPSYFGFNNNNKVGVLYNSTKINDSDFINHQYLFGSISFPDQSFAVGFDLSNYHLERTNYKITNPRLVFIYPLQISQKMYLLPSISVGFWNKSIHQDSFIFEDQINTVTGYINPETNDPLGSQSAQSNYTDFSASFILHSDLFLLGLSLSQINQPNIAFDKENPIKGPINFTLQGGREWDINPFERSFLPAESYLYVFSSLSYKEQQLALNLTQDLQVGQFSIGTLQRLSFINSLDMNGIGLHLGLALDNFDFGMQYYFPIRKQGFRMAPRIFELYLIFEFTPFRRNSRGSVKRLQINNY